MEKPPNESSERPSSVACADLTGAGTAAKHLVDGMTRLLGIAFKKRDVDGKVYEIKAIAHALGEATKNVSVAEYHSDGIILKSQASAGNTDSGEAGLLERAQERQRIQAIRGQRNIESITIQALQQLGTSNANTERTLDDEWLSRFLDAASPVSDEQMQALWAKILASEAQNPGTCSKRTIQCLAVMGKADALAFEKLCQFCCSYVDSDGFCVCHPFILNHGHSFYASHGMTFDSLLHLVTAGLINLGRVQKFETQFHKNLVVKYHSARFFPKSPATQNGKFFVGRVLFTQSGTEVARICSTKPVDNFVEHLISEWRANGIEVRVEFDS